MQDKEFMSLVATKLSEQTGRICALEAALLGVLRASAPNESLRSSVLAEIENAYAVHLGSSENAKFLSEFEALKGLVVEALQPPPVAAQKT